MNLNPGAPCRVRLHDGRVVLAVYVQRANNGPHHWVKFNDALYQTVGLSYLMCESLYGRARFVGNPCVLEPV